VESKSVSIPREELRTIFPSLDLPVDDKIAKTTISVVQWGSTIFLFAIGLFTAKKWRDSNTARIAITPSETILHQQRPSSSSIFCQYIANSLAALFSVIIIVSVLVLSYDLIFVVPKTTSQSKYFICEGVQNGIAIGTTFPVPECFTDLTIQSNHDHFVSSGNFLKNEFSHLMMIAALALLDVWIIRHSYRLLSNVASRSTNSQYESVAPNERGDQESEILIEEASIEDAFTLLAEGDELEDTVDDNHVGEEDTVVQEHS